MADKVRELAGQTNKSTEEVHTKIGDIEKINRVLVDEIGLKTQEAREVALAVEGAVKLAGEDDRRPWKGWGTNPSLVSDKVSQAYDRFKSILN